MATQRTRENLGPFDSEADAIVLDRRKGRLRHTAPLGELVLAQTLKFPDNANRFSDRDFCAFLRRAKLIHLKSPVIVGGNRHDLKCELFRNDAVDQSKLRPKSTGPMAIPFPRKRFVTKPANLAQPWWARNRGYVLPLLVALQNLPGQRGALFVNASMLEDFPHAILCIYRIRYVNQASG